jgi:peptide chain release factor 1
MNTARVTHIPTGVQQIRGSRDKEKNLREAMDAVNVILDEMGRSKTHEAMAADRRGQVGSGQRGDKFRTYRFQEDQVADGRTGRRARASDVMRGRFELLW